MSPTVRRLDVTDLEACLVLGSDRQWPREDHKWRLLFSIGRVYGVEDPDGSLAAAVVASPYGTSVNAISMMLVARKHERRGLGGHILSHALADVGAEGALLTATPMGKPLYEKLGFRTVGLCSTLRGAPADPITPSGRSRPFTAADLPAVTALDTDVFGAPRTELIAALPEFCDSFRVVDGPDGVVGFGGAWPNDGTTVLGPITAPDQDTALALLDDLAATAPGELRMDVDHRAPHVLKWAEQARLEHRFTTDIMVLGPDTTGDHRSHTPVMLALG